MWEGPEDELTLTHNAQPAILAHSAAVLAVVATGSAGSARRPVTASASTARTSRPRTLTVADAARLVRRRGELMLEAGPAAARRDGRGAGTCRPAEVEAACNEASDDGGVAVAANLNAPDQTVISGDPAAVDRAPARRARRGAPSG